MYKRHDFRDMLSTLTSIELEVYMTKPHAWRSSSEKSSWPHSQCNVFTYLNSPIEGRTM